MEDTVVKKQRLRNACDNCRRRKIRCNSAETADNICSSCIHLGIDCTHLMSKTKPGPRTGNTAVRSLVNRILSTKVQFETPSDPTIVKQMLNELANHARNLDRQLSILKKTPEAAEKESSSPSSAASPTSMDMSEPAPEFEDSIDSLTQDLGNINITEHRHFGKSSNFMLVQAALDARHNVPGFAGQDRNFLFDVFNIYRRPQFWNVRSTGCQSILHVDSTAQYAFPPSSLLRELIDVYFANSNIIFPLLHRPTFERTLAEGLHLQDRYFGAVVLAVCAVAAPHSESQSATTDPTGWDYFRQVPLIRDFAVPPSLYYLQLCSLCVLYLHAPETSWGIIGIGIRSAQVIGKHLKLGTSNVENRGENELWKRAFWCLVSLDIFMSTMMGRPRATTAEDFDIDVPLECDDEFWEESPSGPPFVQPPDKPSMISFFTAFIKLLEILGFAQRTLYGVRKSEMWSGMGITTLEWKEKAVVELDSALNRFIDAIPSHLKWDPNQSNPIFLQQSAMLWSVYYWVQIQVHRPFIPRPGKASILPGFPSLAICCNAARKTLSLLDSLQTNKRAGNGIASEMILLTPMFSSSIVLLLNLWMSYNTTKEYFENTKDLKHIYCYLDLVRSYENKYQFAGRVIDLMTALLAIGELPLRTPGTGLEEVDPRVTTFTHSSTLDSLPAQTSTLHPSGPQIPGGFGFGSNIPDYSDSNGNGGTGAQLTQEDWDMFMANIDVLITTGAGTGDYQGYM